MKDCSGGIPSAVYDKRFDSLFAFRNKMWNVLCTKFFNKYSTAESSVLEIAAGHCEFINNIDGKIKFAVDINPKTTEFAASNVTVIHARAEDVDILDTKFDLIFIFNFFEHIEKPQILKILTHVHTFLKKIENCWFCNQILSM